MRKTVLIFLLVTLSSLTLNSQEELTWQDFADVNFEPVFNEELGLYFMKPEFGDHIKSYSGKQISILGYFLDFSGDNAVYLISKNPFASCFFCGADGPETVIAINFKEKPSFKMDQIVLVTGVLELNADDVERSNYILNEATGATIN